MRSRLAWRDASINFNSPERTRAARTPWRYSSSTNIYGTSGGWTSAINSGGGVISGYRRATEPLRAFGAALSNIPANQVERVKRDFATVELTDAANIHGIEVLGLQRAKARGNERAIQDLEGATLSTADAMNTQIAVLNKINAAGMMATARDPSRVRKAKPYGPALDCSLAVAKITLRLARRRDSRA
jgi:hypothetical protein